MRSRIGLAFCLAVASFLFLSNTAAQAVTVFADGLTHTIDSPNSWPPQEEVFVGDGAGATATTLNLLDGGPGGSFIVASEHSNINFIGGSYGGELRGQSVGTITGGSQSGISLFDSATLTMTGGSVTIGLDCSDQAHLSVIGGSVNRLASFGGLAEVHGGTITGLGGLVAVLATLDGRMHIFGGTFPSVEARHESIITIFGSDFNLPLGDIDALSGTLSGVLSDGTPLNATFVRASTATITLVPEPSTGPLVMTGLLGIAYRQRRHGRAQIM